MSAKLDAAQREVETWQETEMPKVEQLLKLGKELIIEKQDHAKIGEAYNELTLKMANVSDENNRLKDQIEKITNENTQLRAEIEKSWLSKLIRLFGK